jgi:hypothetical protein
LNTALIPSAIGLAFLYDLARLTNGVINGQQPIKGHGGFTVQLGRAAPQQSAETPDPIFLAGKFIRRVVTPTLVGKCPR